MAIIRIAPVVEGDGEVNAFPLLLRRIAGELLSDVFFDVLQPWRLKRGYVLPAKPEKLSEALNVLALKLLRHPGEIADVSLILVLMDRDPSHDPTCQLAPRLLAEVQKFADPRVRISCVIADSEFESWFVAAASSLTDDLEFDIDHWKAALQDEMKKGKGWIKRHLKKRSYSETVDQPRLTAKMDLRLCRQNSPSFDKLCRELVALV